MDRLENRETLEEKPVFSVYEKEDGTVRGEVSSPNDTSSVIWSVVRLLRTPSSEATMIVTSALIHVLSVMTKEESDGAIESFRTLVDGRRNDIAGKQMRNV